MCVHRLYALLPPVFMTTKLCVRNSRGDAVLVSTARVIITGVQLPPRTRSARVWRILVEWLVEHRVLWFNQLRRLGDLCRAAYHAHVASWQPRVISYATWLRLGGGILLGLERRNTEQQEEDP